MYSTWWAFALQAATARTDTGAFAYQPPDFSAAASAISRDVGGQYARFDPVGLSQLFSLGRQIGAAQGALAAAADSDRLTPGMYAEAPWSRSPAGQDALNMWQARVEVEYADEQGVVQSGTFTVTIPQVLPATVGSLRAQLALRITDMLATPPGTGTPRSGTLVSAGSVTILQV